MSLPAHAGSVRCGIPSAEQRIFTICSSVARADMADFGFKPSNPPEELRKFAERYKRYDHI